MGKYLQIANILLPKKKSVKPIREKTLEGVLRVFLTYYLPVSL
jgi:hypothetical protein